MLRRLAQSTACEAIAQIDGATLLGERAMLAGWRIPDRISAGGGSHLFDTSDGAVAVNLSRPCDRELLPALFQSDSIDPDDIVDIATQMRESEPEQLVARGRAMGLAIAAEREAISPAANLGTCVLAGVHRSANERYRPRVLDLSALWAGPLAAHLLWLAGAEVVKVESRSRPDAMRAGDRAFYTLLNQGKDSVLLDFRDAFDRQALVSLIARSDIVIEASRPRALQQLGIDVSRLVASTPGLVWVTITAHGCAGDAADWVGFGDDCGVAAGLSAELRAAAGAVGFVGDAIADPLTGVAAASLAWEAWKSARGGRFGVALSQVSAYCLAQAKATDQTGFTRGMRRCHAARGQPFPKVTRRPMGAAASLGEHSAKYLDGLSLSARRSG